jgi:predicted GIY-YIG superfamily endonuclease
MASKERQIAEARETFLKKIKRKWKAAAIQDARVQYAEERMRPKAAE